MRIRNVLIKTAKLEMLKEFYESVLALPVTAKGRSLIEIQIGKSTLQVEPTDEGNPFYHFAINIPANKIDEAKSWLIKKVELLWMEAYHSDIADFRNWHAKSVYFFDPAGNIVELIARFDLRNDSTEKFSSQQLLSISELGLVFPEDQIDKEVEDIMQRTALSYFLKQPPMQQFKVLGDDEGLMIIVTEDRNWYPTNMPSKIFPLQIHFEEDGRMQVLQFS